MIGAITRDRRGSPDPAETDDRRSPFFHPSSFVESPLIA